MLEYSLTVYNLLLIFCDVIQTMLMAWANQSIPSRDLD